ncbi:MAG TPA: MoaD/ThiS family protein [Candidatus Tectomicrobia bacterium]|nr:MoaD/ThiS family protein [Candidatus Tectomicrobia bacterium]
MATVYIPEPLQSLSRGETQVTIEATTVRQIIVRLEALYPGLEAALVEDGDLKPHIAVAVDGEVSVLGLVERVEADSEVHFIPALGGGSRGR